MRAWALLILVLFIMSCAPPQMTDGPSNPLDPFPDDIPLRPDIPHTPTEPEDNYQAPPDEPTNIPGTIFVDGSPYARSIGLEVPLNELLGEHHPIITRHEFPLLKHGPILVEQALAESYYEEIIFDHDENTTGEIRFTKDDDDNIGSFLFFEEDKYILQYRLTLSGFYWWELESREIQILGHKYVIAEASNTTVKLYGIDVDNNLLFIDGKRLKVQSQTQPDTLAIVRPDMISFILIAEDVDDDGILLAPGESLSENVGQNKLASQLLDIRYDGAPLQDASRIRLDRNRHGYSLEFTTIDERKIDITLVEDDAGHVILGKLDEPLKYMRCPAENRYCIQPEDNILLTSSNGETYLMKYSGIENDSNNLRMKMDGNRYQYEILGDLNRTAWADLIIDDNIWRVDVSPYDPRTEGYNISINQAYYDDAVEIVTLGDFRIRLGELTDDTLPLEIIIPARYTRDRYDDITPVNLTYDGEWSVTVGNITFFEDERTDDEYGLSEYGMAVWIDKDDENYPDGSGAEAEFMIPSETVYGTVLLEG
ncbi:hypothetical protein GOV11_02625 [Candidatus Woesearchaeota archaeon]|nr:hypothetical protein [Candidatus Woesearchaeota archaeon]